MTTPSRGQGSQEIMDVLTAVVLQALSRTKHKSARISHSRGLPHRRSGCLPPKRPVCGPGFLPGNLHRHNRHPGGRRDRGKVRVGGLTSSWSAVEGEREGPRMPECA